MLTLSVTSILFALMLFGIPLAFALAVAGALGLYLVGGAGLMMGILETAPLSAAASYELLTVPMFMLMAEFVILSGIADNLFRAATVWVGRVPGGLGVATALAGAGFGAISGSSTAAAATLSATSIPAMERAGYHPRHAGGTVAISGTLAMLIPPSVAIVIYGIITEESIGELLIAGIVPGILVALTISATIVALVMRTPDKRLQSRAYTMREKIESLKVVGPMLALFFVVTGVIYLGVATPTEAAGLGAFGAMLLTWREGKLNRVTLVQVLTRAAHTTCMILVVIMAAHIFGYFFTLTGVTQSLVGWIGDLEISRWVVIALILAVYIVLGCFLDQISVLILTVPLSLPLILSLGFDPVWFGILVIITAEIGMVTPPIGLNVFVVSRYTGRPVEEVFYGTAPHVVTQILLLAVLVSFPGIILWLPSTMAQ